MSPRQTNTRTARIAGLAVGWQTNSVAATTSTSAAAAAAAAAAESIAVTAVAAVAAVAAAAAGWCSDISGDGDTGGHT